MLRLAAISLTGRRVLTVESDYDIAADMAGEIQRSGGTVVGAVPGIAAALTVLGMGIIVDCIMIATTMAEQVGAAGLDRLRRHGAEIIFVTGFDDWFEEEENVPELLFASA